MEDDRPEDALAIYHGQVGPTIAGKNKKAYREAVELLRKIRELLLRLNRGASFTEYLVAVREAHKRKRNLIKLLDEADWS